MCGSLTSRSATVTSCLEIHENRNT